jgi:hypothetical protein
MFRHNCAACGRAINRLDTLFEPSDGTLCSDCIEQLAPDGRSRKLIVLRAQMSESATFGFLPAMVRGRRKSAR